MTIDPKLRKRVETPRVSAEPDRALTNSEWLASFQRASVGKLAKESLEGYTGSIRDAIAYFTDGSVEIPIRRWTKQGVWEYVHFMQANYCASLQAMPFNPAAGVLCRKRVWVGARAPQDAIASCQNCAQFKPISVEMRLKALNRFFRYLARLGVIPVNFMPDVQREVSEETRVVASGEKRRNPSIDEMRRLVNETMHPRNRAYYAASAKWWFRPNEMFMLDRYASFGITRPTDAAWANGFAAHPDLPSFEDGGDMVYLPETKGPLDKRQGNRWSVIDAELRPILKAYFAWWDATVARDETGAAVTTNLWITSQGRAIQLDKMYKHLFHKDTDRLGLTRPADRMDLRRNWTSHCQRHFGEKLLEMSNVPDNWCNHFRGDVLRDARREYFHPTPQQVRAKYHELVPRIGFSPVPRLA